MENERKLNGKTSESYKISGKEYKMLFLEKMRPGNTLGVGIQMINEEKKVVKIGKKNTENSTMFM